MLRITMLKLKRTWSLALSLRNKGDSRVPGKFHRLMTVRTAQKSTNTDKNNARKRKQIIDYLFSPLRTHEEIRWIRSIIINDIRRIQRAINKQKKEQVPQKHISPKAQSEICNKLIATIFGNQKSLDLGKVPDAEARGKVVKTVLSTTAKQTAEQLAQKVEVINETPLVEAEKPKIEGFNTPPRVLGHDSRHSDDIDCETNADNLRNKYKSMIRRLEHSEIISKVTPMTYGVVNFSSDCSNHGGKSGDTSGGKSGDTPGGDKKDDYDSIAKRHLNSPSNELDNRLIKEMQQLGVPEVSGNSSINVLMGAKKPRKPSAKTEIEFETRKCKHEPPIASEEHTADLEKQINLRTSQATHETFVSRLHEEGIRYTEQTAPSLEDKREKNRLDEPTLRSNDKTKNIATDKQETTYLTMEESRAQPPVSASQGFRFAHERNVLCTKEPLVEVQTEDHPRLRLDANIADSRALFNIDKPMIHPHDKNSIASNTETYGCEPLRYSTAKDTTHEEDNEPVPEKTGGQPLIDNQTVRSYRDLRYSTNEDRKQTFASKFHEEGIRYTEQTAPSLENKREENHLDEPILRSNDKTKNIATDKQETTYLTMEESRAQPPVSASQGFRFAHERNVLCSKEPLVEVQTEGHPRLRLDANIADSRPLFDIDKPIIDPHDKNSIASDTETYGYEPLRYSTAKDTTHEEDNESVPEKSVDQPLIDNQTVRSYRDIRYSSVEDTKQKENDEPEPEKTADQPLIVDPTVRSYRKITPQEVHLNREMPYYHNYNENFTNFSQFPNQQNVWSGYEGYQPTRYHTENVTDQHKNDEELKSADQSSIGDQTPVLHPDQNINLNRDMPYYHNYNENFTNFSQLPDQQNAWSRYEGYQTSRYDTAHVTDQHENYEESKTEDQSSIANQTSKSHPEVTFESTHFNRDMPYYYNRNITHFSQLPNEQNTWSNFEAYKPEQHVVKDTDRQKPDENLPTDDPDQSSIYNSTPRLYHRDGNYLDMNLNRDMPYYYNQSYTYSAQYPSQQYEEPTGSYLNVSQRFDPNHMAINKYTVVHDKNSELLPSDSENTYMTSADTQNNSCDERVSSNYNSPSISSQQNPCINQYQYFHRQESSQSHKNLLADANPDDIFLDQHTGDPSFDESYQLNPWMNPYQYSQQTNQNITADKYPVGVNSDQHAEPSEEVSHDHWMNKQNPNRPSARAGQVEQLHTALYAADYSKRQPVNFQQGFSNFPQQFNPWQNQYNQFPYNQSHNYYKEGPSKGQQEPHDINQPDTDRIPPYGGHKPISSYHATGTDQQTGATDMLETESEAAPQQLHYPSFQTFQHPAGIIAQNPYYFQQCYSYFGKFPYQQNFWGHQNSPGGQMSQVPDVSNQNASSSPHQDTSIQGTISPDQKTPIQATDMRPVLQNFEDKKYQPPVGPSAGFVSLPEVEWRGETPSSSAPKERPVPEHNMQADYLGAISSLPEVNIPLPKDQHEPLSEMLRKARHRSRQEYIARWARVEPLEGKCGRKRPPCPPPQPMCPKAEPTPPPPCPPPPPACPRSCKPKCPPPCSPPRPGCPPPSPPCTPPKCPCCKFEAISLGDTLRNIFTLIRDFGSGRLVHEESLVPIALRDSASCTTGAVITEDVATQPGILENNKLTTYGSDLGKYFWKLETLALARGFEPWVPVPSWPLPIKKKLKPYVCPKEGCKERPPPRYGDPCEPPCYPGNPCQGFPNRYRKH